jgi:hypothetical protein
VLQICQQIAYIFLPVGSAITTMQKHLRLYLEATGAVPPRSACTVSETAPPEAESTSHSREATNILQKCALTGSNSNDSVKRRLLSGRPSDYLTTLLPQVMFDYVACLLNMGMRMDEIARQHNIKDLRALDILKQQVRRSINRLPCIYSEHVLISTEICYEQAWYNEYGSSCSQRCLECARL